MQIDSRHRVGYAELDHRLPIAADRQRLGGGATWWSDAVVVRIGESRGRFSRWWCEVVVVMRRCGADPPLATGFEIYGGGDLRRRGGVLASSGGGDLRRLELQIHKCQWPRDAVKLQAGGGEAVVVRHGVDETAEEGCCGEPLSSSSSHYCYRRPKTKNRSSRDRLWWTIGGFPKAKNRSWNRSSRGFLILVF